MTRTSIPLRRAGLGAAAAMLFAAALAQNSADARPGDRLRAMIARKAESASTQPPVAAPAPKIIAYGRDPLQTLNFWPADPKERTELTPPPLIVYVHGGGWQRGSKDNATGQWKPVHYPKLGYAFASIDYRLVPQARVEDQASDVAFALKALLDRARLLGFDPRSVVLMGHSAGAHLVALVGTDERYLRNAGLRLADVAGVIAIDGAAYDVPRQMAGAGRFMEPVYRNAFGTDPGRQRTLSPTVQATIGRIAPGRAPHFLLLHVQREDGVNQAEALEAALQRAGTPVQRNGFPGEGLQGHMVINRSLGDPAYPATAVVDEWLDELFAG